MRKQIIRIRKKVVVKPHATPASIWIPSSTPRNRSRDLALHGGFWGEGDVTVEIGDGPEGLTFCGAEAIADVDVAKEGDSGVGGRGNHLVKSEGGP